MLVRRRGETLAQLLTRLDLAIDKALTEEIFTDEINPPFDEFLKCPHHCFVDIQAQSRESPLIGCEGVSST